MRVRLPERMLSVFFVVLGAAFTVAFIMARASGEFHDGKGWMTACFVWGLAFRHCAALRKTAGQ
jgi:hypothetical protein